jgi:hypothetical protein
VVRDGRELRRINSIGDQRVNPRTPAGQAPSLERYGLPPREQRQAQRGIARIPQRIGLRAGMGIGQ